MSPASTTRGLMRLAAVCSVTAAAAFGVGYAVAGGTTGSCNVNASGGYANCLTFMSPTFETVKANHSAGTPYRFRLYRPLDGGSWGPWNYSDLAYHTVPLSVSNNITEQVDNVGTANPGNYYVEMGN